MIKVLKRSFLLLFILFNIFLVTRELLNFDRFYEFELYGFAHEDDQFRKVCNFKNPFQETLSSEAVASTREDSLLYKTPSKLLYNSVNPYVTHRIVTILSYIVFIVSSCYFVLLLTKNYAITFIFLSYITLYSQFLSYYFEYKLTNTSLALISLTFLFIYLFHESLIHNKKSSFAYAFLLPFILINLGYEVFCISRPLNMALFAFIFLYLCIYNRKNLLVFIAGAFSSILLIKYNHPNIKFNLTLFSARGESLHNSISNLDFSILLQHLKARILEIPLLFKMPRNHLYVSESTGDMGFLDIFIALLVAFLIILVILCANLIKTYKRKQTCSGKISTDDSIDTTNFKEIHTLHQIKKNSFLINITLLSMFISFCTPFFSIAYLRGHRFANFYYASIILLIILISIIFHKAFIKYKILTSTFFIACACYIFYFKVNIFLHYNFNINLHNESQACIHSIKSLTQEVKNIEKVDKIFFCDREDHPIYYPTFNGILYISKLACKRTNFSNAIVVQQYNDNKPCICKKEENDICLIRKSPCNISIMK